MSEFTDIHSHILYNVDDGAKDEAEMFSMLKSAYEDGIRTVCLTPHYHPDKFESDSDDLRVRIDILSGSAKEKFPDLKIYLGNEILYHNECAYNLARGKCLTLAGGRCVLVEFLPDAEFLFIKNGLGTLMTSGYIPVLAHVERYICLFENNNRAGILADSGVLLQANASSVLGISGPSCKTFLHRLLKKRLIYVIATDAHSSTTRTPELSKCFSYISKKYGERYAHCLFCENPRKIIDNEIN